MNIATEMPRYRSHKTVWALEIKKIRPLVLALDESAAPLWYIVTPVDAGYAKVKFKGEVFARYMPIAGDFIVQYDDGHWSVSPRKAFIEGYTPISNYENAKVNATGWLDQRSLIDDVVRQVRQRALELANAGRDSSDAAAIVGAAAQFEAYMLNGAPAKTDALTYGGVTLGKSGSTGTGISDDR